MKKVIFSVLMIAIVGSLVGIGTWAYFSDYETSRDNLFTAGKLDLKVNDLDDPLPVYFDETCLMPCDEGQVELTLMNDGCVPGMLNFKLYNLRNNDNGLTEPESDVDATGGDGQGELAENMSMEVWADCTGGTNYDSLVISGMVADLEDELRYFCDCIADQEVVGLLITWEIDCAVENIIQTDSIAFDIEFSLEQEPCMYECWLDVTGFDQPLTVIQGSPYNFDVLVHCDCAGEEGACSGTVYVEVKDGAGATAWAGSQYIADQPYCDTVPVSFSMDTTGVAVGSYTVVADEMECPFEIMEPGLLVVTDIQQPPAIQICEDLSVGIDIHNQGGVATSGMVFTCVVNPEGNPLVLPQMVDTGTIDPGQTVTIAVDFGHVGAAWRPGGAVVAGFPVSPLDPQEEELFICPMGFLLPATFEVVGIQQPAGAQPCEEHAISVDIHNVGDKSGSATVNVWVEDKDGNWLWPVDELGNPLGPASVITDPIEPCVTTKVPIGVLHIDDSWLGLTVYVLAQAGLTEPFICPINIVGGPCIVVTGIQQPEVIEECDELVVAVDVHNAGGKPGECSVDVWVEDAIGNIIVAAQTLPVPELNPCDTEKIPVVLGHVGTDIPPLPVIVVVAQACCDIEPWRCPIEVITEIPTVSYDAEGVMLLWTSLDGAPAEEPMPSPAVCGFDIEYSGKQAGSVYRDLTIPAASWWWFPYCGQEAVPMLHYVTINVIWDPAHPEGGDGRLYVEEDGIDVDIAGETTEAGTALTWGDGTADPAGSAYIHMYLEADVYSQKIGPADPLDPSTWGTLVLPVPMEFWYTTALSTNHVTDVVNPGFPGVALTCNTISEGPGVPFAEDGGALVPYHGTSATIVSTGALLDLIVLGFVELDVQYQMNLTLTPAP